MKHSISYQVCIKCKEWVEPDKIKLQVYCEDCWRNNDNSELFRYESVLSWELLLIEHPVADCFYGHKLGHNNKSRGDLYRIGKEKLENLLVEKDAGKKRLEEVGNTSSETYKENVASIRQIQDQLTKILYYKPKD